VDITTNKFSQFLHALIYNWQRKVQRATNFTATTNGNGDGNANGTVNFDPLKQNQRGGLFVI